MLLRNTKALLLCAALGLLGCDDGEDGASPGANSGTDHQVDAGVSPQDGSPNGSVGATTLAQPPAYLAATRVSTPDGAGSTTYMQVLSSIEAGSRLELANATEFAGPAELFNIKEIGWFGVGDGNAPVLTKYTLGADGKLVAGPKLNLAAYGVQEFFADKTYFVSPTKVYYPDPDGKQLLVINPTAMTVDGVVALPQTAREGYTAVYSYAAVRRGDKLLFSVGWFDWTNDRILPETGLVTLDVNTNAVLGVTTDPRCSGITMPVTVSSGDVYFTSSALAGALAKLGRLTTGTCALRIKAGAEVFDPAYAQKLTEVTGGAIAGEPIPAGGDAIFLRVLDDTKVTIKPESASWDLTGEPAWGWARWNVVTGQLTPIAGLEASTADVLWFETEGRVFAGQTTKDYATTTLIELTAAGGPKPALTSVGFFSGLAKIR